MNKKNSVISFLFAACLIIAAVVISFSVSCKKKDGAETILSSNDFGHIADPDAKDEKKINLLGKSLTLSYRFTDNTKESLPGDRADGYGTHDVYIDSENTEYNFLWNTDMLCGFLKADASMDAQSVENPISEADAKATALEFLSAVYSEDKMSGYRIESCKYIGYAGYYDVRYVKTISGYKTDDKIKVWVRVDNSITAFSAFYLGRYDELIKNAGQYDFSAAQTALETQLKNAGLSGYQQDDFYFSLDDGGNPVLIYRDILKDYTQRVSLRSSGGSGTATEPSNQETTAYRQTGDSYPDLEYQAGDIDKIEIAYVSQCSETLAFKMLLRSETFSIATKDGISAVLNTIPSIKYNNGHIPSPLTGSLIDTFRFTYYFKDGSVKTAEHRLYTNGTIEIYDAMKDIWQLDEVIPQVRKIYGVSPDDIAYVCVTRSVNVSHTSHIIKRTAADKAAIAYLLEKGKELSDTRGDSWICERDIYCVYFYDTNDKVLCKYALDDSTPGLDEIKTAVPAVAEVFAEYRTYTAATSAG